MLLSGAGAGSRNRSRSRVKVGPAPQHIMPNCLWDLRALSEADVLQKLLASLSLTSKSAS